MKFGVRHYVKGIKNAIYKLGKRKDCQILLKWQKSVTNTIWYALANYKGNKTKDQTQPY